MDDEHARDPGGGVEERGAIAAGGAHGVAAKAEGTVVDVGRITAWASWGTGRPRSAFAGAGCTGLAKVASVWAGAKRSYAFEGPTGRCGLGARVSWVKAAAGACLSPRGGARGTVNVVALAVSYESAFGAGDGTLGRGATNASAALFGLVPGANRRFTPKQVTTIARPVTAMPSATRARQRSKAYAIAQDGRI
jgi:hypothetical protein